LITSVLPASAAFNAHQIESSMKNNRRQFLASGSVAFAASQLAAATQADNHSKNPIAVFAKHVQELPYSELGRRLQAIGVQGIEATLRRGGQIEPQNLASELGKLCDALEQHGQKVIIAASDVNQVSAASEGYLEQLAKYSIPYFRMAYYRYDFEQPILPQLKAFARQAEELADLCEATGVTALYQNHAGRNYVGAGVWDLLQMLSDISPSNMAVAIDIRHTTLELSQSYQAAYSAIREHVGATYVKDFAWRAGEPINVPLGDGRAKPMFELIKRDGFVGPLSLHMEYTDHNDPTQTEASWQAIAADVKTLQAWLQ
jgi:sugar phosphate isomerase/epimerase